MNVYQQMKPYDCDNTGYKAGLKSQCGLGRGGLLSISIHAKCVASDNH